MKKASWCVMCAAAICAACSDDGIVVDSGIAACDGRCAVNSCCKDVCVDIQHDVLNCGECGHACGEDEFCRSGQCIENEQGDTCEPTTCAAQGVHCGLIDDRCGNSLECGTCAALEVCVQGACIDPTACEPTTCAAQGIACGNIDDGCGNPLTCGTCADSEVCVRGACIDPTQCTPDTCKSLGMACGTLDDGCGGTLECGACTGDLVCTDGQCLPAACVPKTCEALGARCGSPDDGCGKPLECGACTGDLVCISGACTIKPVDCTPTTCAAQGKNCGNIDDGCGHTLSCGTCGANQTCTANVCTCTPTTCAAQGKNCGNIDDGCGHTLSCGTCGANQTCTANVCVDNVTTRDIYPTRKSIKGLQPDFQDTNQTIGNAVHGVAMNMVWALWQERKSTSCTANEVAYEGYCYNVKSGNPAATAAAIKTYSDAGVVVTAIVYGVPAWARRNCSGATLSGDWFCAPKDENTADYGRFVGFLAHYFNGENGHGRIADFVIHNEVNASSWFNIGCNQSTCRNKTEEWITVYANNYNAAYDYARKEQKQAKVLISFDHFFGSSFDAMLSNAIPELSVQTFLTRLVPKLGNRDWMLAYHSYPPDLTKPAFGADDYPRVTFGNLGVLAGWLRQTYPSDPHAWEIHLTENGINGANASMQAQQTTQLCQAFRNVLGTPGITSFIYHRLIDVAEEGLNLGLWNANATPKPAWATYACANRSGSCGGSSSWPSCGFEYGDYTVMMRGSANGKHWVTSRQFPSGVTTENRWKLLRNPAADTRMVYECRIGATGDHTFISTAANCENQFNMGPMGYIYTKQVAGTSPVYRCYNPSSGDHMISPDVNCETSSYKMESLVGYAIKI